MILGVEVFAVKIATSIVGWIILFSSYTLVTLATPMLAVTVAERTLSGYSFSHARGLGATQPRFSAEEFSAARCRPIFR